MTKWISSIPDDVKQDMPYIAPMLSKLGYDPNAYPPSYGEADKAVAENTIHIHNNDEFWRKKSQEIQNMKKVPHNIYNHSSVVDTDKMNPGLVQDHLDTELNPRDKVKYGQDQGPDIVKSQQDKKLEENDLIDLNNEQPRQSDQNINKGDNSNR
jgi:hypothetical protein